MQHYEKKPETFRLARLTEVELPDLAAFDCDDPEMNRFLKEEAFEEQERGLNATILLYYEGSLAAFCSICSDAITLSSEEKEEDGFPYSKVPAIKIARIGRHMEFRDKRLGAWLIEYVKNLAFELATSQLGVRFVTMIYNRRLSEKRSLLCSLGVCP